MNHLGDGSVCPPILQIKPRIWRDKTMDNKFMNTELMIYKIPSCRLKLLELITYFLPHTQNLIKVPKLIKSIN